MTPNRRRFLASAMAAMGGGLSAAAQQAVDACLANGAARDNGAFTSKEKAMVDVLVELIIPKTETPGAEEAGVSTFVASMVRHWYLPAQRASFIAGLRMLDLHCKTSFGRQFLACANEQKTIALEDCADGAAGTISDGEFGGASTRRAAQRSDVSLWNDRPIADGSAFFHDLRDLTVLGYYTSEVGIFSELRFDPVPGVYDGDVPFAQVQKHSAFG